MAASDSSIGVLNQTTSTVAPVDVSQLTNAEGATVNRQRVAIGDAGNASSVAGVSLEGSLAVSDGVAQEILGELRAIRIGIGFLIGKDLATFTGG